MSLEPAAAITLAKIVQTLHAKTDRSKGGYVALWHFFDLAPMAAIGVKPDN